MKALVQFFCFAATFITVLVADPVPPVRKQLLEKVDAVATGQPAMFGAVAPEMKEAMRADARVLLH
jgi:hypothetical protein